MNVAARATGVDALLQQFRHRYPDALAVCAEMVNRRGNDGLDWPHWCWLPMAGTLAYLTAGQANPGDVARVAALTQWRLTRGLYLLDEAVADTAVSELWEAAGGPDNWHHAILPPLDRWTHLPQQCCYVAWPPAVVPSAPLPTLKGVFIHLESDANSGRPELRLLVDTDSCWDGLVPIPVYLDRPNLGAAMADAGAAASAAYRGVTGADVRSLSGPSVIMAMAGLTAWLVMPLALALIDPHANYVNIDQPGQAPTPATRRDKHWLPAPRTTAWLITYDKRPQLRLV
ncbi:hypothetical protein F0Q45_08300 [Mycobacterium simiae]|uniref:Uncharacterized protein n=1 Tax=Mycobacterium simiae TaxID=1784 RepID=A0A5B1BSC5_MYCSI|nr:hypothetical protein [Mycobacterium simiae]KAA1250685.1 hypothetical protein F0Q45_08300 [Mycobacterium simiae]